MPTLADAGVAIMCASGDHEELAALCDRVLVFSDGRLQRELNADEVTRERIAAECYGDQRLQVAGAEETRSAEH